MLEVSNHSVKNAFEGYPSELRGKEKEGDRTEHSARKNKTPS